VFIKDGDSRKNENLFGKVLECLCLCRECERREEAGGRRQEGGGRGKVKLHYPYLIFNHVTSVTGFLQVWPTFENVTVNSSLDWDEQTRVGNFDVFEYNDPCFFR